MFCFYFVLTSLIHKVPLGLCFVVFRWPRLQTLSLFGGIVCFYCSPDQGLYTQWLETHLSFKTAIRQFSWTCLQTLVHRIDCSDFEHDFWVSIPHCPFYKMGWYGYLISLFFYLIISPQWCKRRTPAWNARDFHDGLPSLFLCLFNPKDCWDIWIIPKMGIRHLANNILIRLRGSRDPLYLYYQTKGGPFDVRVSCPFRTSAHLEYCDLTTVLMHGGEEMGTDRSEIPNSPGTTLWNWTPEQIPSKLWALSVTSSL